MPLRSLPHRTLSLVLAVALSGVLPGLAGNRLPKLAAAPAEELPYSLLVDGQSGYGPAQLWLNPPVNMELADDFEVIGEITRVFISGFQFYANPDFRGLYLRFYQFAPGSPPGALQAEYYLPAGDPGLGYDPARADWFDITLPAPFHAGGQHFVAVQPVIDFAWTWWSANTNQPRGQTFYFRDLHDADPNWRHGDHWQFSNPNADLAFSLYGTVTGAPRASPTHG